jgi:triacylglycerol lipase
MGTTLSPFRYVQVARYMINRWLDHAPGATSKWKGKGKAKPLTRATAASSPSGTLKYSTGSDTPSGSDGQWEKATPDNASGSSSGGAGPSTSRTKLQPDPRMPAQSTEIYRLMNDERLLVRDRKNAPKEIIVLCHGQSHTPHAHAS